MSRRPSWTTKAIADPPAVVAVIDEEWEVPAVAPAPPAQRPMPAQAELILPQAWGVADEWKAKTITLPDGRTETTILRVSCCPDDRTIAEWCDEMDTALMDRYERRAFLARKVEQYEPKADDTHANTCRHGMHPEPCAD